MHEGEKPAEEPLARLLWRAHHWFRVAVTTDHESGLGELSLAHATLLSQLDPGGMPIADLARLIGVSTPAIHQLVQRLIALGLVEIVPNPRSRRSKLVLLTPKGLTRRRQALKVLAELEAELGRRIGEHHVASLRAALEQDWGEPV